MGSEWGTKPSPDRTLNMTTKRTTKRDGKREGKCYYEAVVGRARVLMYRRKTSAGNWNYMVANTAQKWPVCPKCRRQFNPENWPTLVQGSPCPGGFSRKTGQNVACDGKLSLQFARRWESFNDEGRAREVALGLAKLLNEQDLDSAALTKEQRTEYAGSVLRLREFNPLPPEKPVYTVDSVTSLVVDLVKDGADLAAIREAWGFYKTRNKNKRVERKRVQQVVDELLKLMEGRGKSTRYLSELRSRLGQFATDFQQDICDVTSHDVQAWLDGRREKPQTYKNHRRVLHRLFGFAVARNYAADNPINAVESVKVRRGEPEIFSVEEMKRLLSAASPEFVPCLAIGAFAGLRSAEILRLDWRDISLSEKHIVLSSAKAKTASRRIVPIQDNLVEWLAPYEKQLGPVWPMKSSMFCWEQTYTAAATEIKADPEKGFSAVAPVRWKGNGLRHSYISYRLAQLGGDAGRVAGEAGNSPRMVHEHYNALVKPKAAEQWFSLRPNQPDNVLNMPKAQVGA
jgi:integrase